VRVAVVYHLANPGGITRFTHALIDGLIAADPEVSIDYFVSDRLVDLGRLQRPADPGRVRTIAIRDPDVIDSNLDDPSPEAASSIASRLGRHLDSWPALHDFTQQAYHSARDHVRGATGRRVGKRWFEFALPSDVAETLDGYDVVYLPFPYYLEPSRIRAPLVATFHDFNHLYFPENFGRPLLRRIDRQLGFWTSAVDAAVVSTRFVEADLLRHYPAAAGRSHVIYVAPYSLTPITEPERTEVLRKFGLVDAGYVIYPSNHSHHKNLAALVQAADLMKRRASLLRYPIVFTGFGTEGLGTGKWPSFAAVDDALAKSELALGEDIRGLGFVTDREVDALTRSARVVTSTSLYEAGCGPALDAWQFGVPVAFSDIPPFVEQMTSLGVEAWVFDPRDPQDVAAVLSKALMDRDRSLEMAARSKSAIREHTWVRAAESYLAAFRDAINHYRTR
jgi:glycosyltransferase involved in cell wall biosynthesis